MKINQALFLSSALIQCSLIVLFTAFPGPRLSAQDWMKTMQRSMQSASQSVQRSTESIRRDYDNWQRQNGPQVQRQIDSYSQSVRQELNRKSRETQQWWDREGRRQVNGAAGTAQRNMTQTWNRYSPQVQRELRKTYNQCDATVVNRCTQAVSSWGETTGIRLSEYYRKYGKSAGDRLYANMGRYSSQVRQDIVEGYAKWGPGVGYSLKSMYDTYGTQVGQSVMQAYQHYGPIVGTEIKAAYDQWGPVVGNNIKSAYMTYGIQTGEVLQEAYLQFDATVGEEIRTEYLPRIAAYAMDEQNQKMAIQTAGAVLNIYRNRKEIVHTSLKHLAETKIETRYGRISMADASRGWIRKNCPALVGTDIEQDPAKVVTYVLVFPDKEVIFRDLKLIPNGHGEALTCTEKLSEVSGVDVDATIEVLDVMADIESVATGDVDAEMIIENSGRIQTALDEMNKNA